MARKKRITLPNMTYFVGSRCIEWRSMMSKNKIKDEFISTMQRTSEKYSFDLLFFVILHDHFHFFIKTVPDGPSISIIMQHFKSLFATKFNKLTHRTGPFWNERFSSDIIELHSNPREYFLALLWHTAYNVVRRKIVPDPRKYKYNGIQSYLKENFNCPLKQTLSDYFIQLGKGFKEERDNFLKYEKNYMQILENSA